MVKRIAMSMVEGLVAALSGSTDPNEVGDLQWSARTNKAKWLKCEGQAVSRTTYADLFSEIGVTFGAGDGSMTFNLPDVRGRALIGVGAATADTSARAIGAKGGAETHVLTEAQMPAHNHTGSTASAGEHSHAAFSSSGSGGGPILQQNYDSGLYSSATTGSAGAHTHTLTIDSKGGGAAHNNMPPFLGANLFIYAGV